MNTRKECGKNGVQKFRLKIIMSYIFKLTFVSCYEMFLKTSEGHV